MRLRNSPLSLASGKTWPVLTVLIACLAASPAPADVITDRDTKASTVASPAALGEREAAIVDLAMFDAVNSLTRRYTAYLVREDGFEAASPEAAAAAAAATSLSRLHPQKSCEFQAALQEYLKGLAAPRDALALGTQLGQRVAQRVFDSHATDGATATYPYRPRTAPGVFAPPGRQPARSGRHDTRKPTR